MSNQATYIAQARTVQDLWNSLQNLCKQIVSISAVTTQAGSQTAWNAMATATQIPSGVLGAPDVAGSTGTISVVQNSPIATFSTSQTGLAGKYIVVLGDSTSGQYLVAGGLGVTWQLVTPYLGPTLATAAWSTLSPNNANPITVSALNMSANDLATALTDMNTVLTVMNGTSGTIAAQNRLAHAPSLTTLTS